MIIAQYFIESPRESAAYALPRRRRTADDVAVTAQDSNGVIRSPAHWVTRYVAYDSAERGDLHKVEIQCDADWAYPVRITIYT